MQPRRRETLRARVFEERKAEAHLTIGVQTIASLLQLSRCELSQSSIVEFHNVVSPEQRSAAKVLFAMLLPHPLIPSAAAKLVLIGLLSLQGLVELDPMHAGGLASEGMALIAEGSKAFVVDMASAHRLL